MNKKFLTAFLFGATVLASTSTFVSCKDYDDEIGSLQTQVDNEVTARKALEEKVKAAEAAIKALQDHETECDGLVKNAIDGLQKALDAQVDKEAKDVVALNAAIDKALVDAKAYTDAAIAISEDKASKTYATIKDVKAQIDDVLGKYQALSDEIAAARGTYATLKAALDAQETVLKKYSDDNLKKALDEIKKAKEDLEKHEKECDASVSAALETIYKAFDPVNGTLDGLQNAVKNQEVNVAKLEAYAKELKETIIPGIQDDIKKVNEKLEVMSAILSAQLRSLVFMPYLYVDGIEATRYRVLVDTVLVKEKCSPIKRQRAGWEREILGVKKIVGKENYEKTLKNFNDYIYKTPLKQVFYGPVWPVDYHMNPTSAEVAFSEIKGFKVLNPEVITRTGEANAIEVNAVEKYPNGSQVFGINKGELTVGIQVAQKDLPKLFDGDPDAVVNHNPDLNPNNDPYTKKPTIDPTVGTIESATGHYSYGKDYTVALQVYEDDYKQSKKELGDTITSDYAMIYGTKVLLDGIIWNTNTGTVKDGKLADKGYENPLTDCNSGMSYQIDTDEWYYDPYGREGMKQTEAHTQDTKTGNGIKYRCGQHIHVYDTPEEALFDLNPVQLFWNDKEGIKLEDYLGLHWYEENVNRTGWSGIYSTKFTDKTSEPVKGAGNPWKQYGLSYEFEFVNYLADGNNTSDSKYAYWKSADESKLNVDEKTIDGYLSADGHIIAGHANTSGEYTEIHPTTGVRKTEQNKSSVDKEPLVRVMVKHGADVLLDGYILVHITDEAPVQEVATVDFSNKIKFDLCNDAQALAVDWRDFSDEIAAHLFKDKPEYKDGIAKGTFDSWFGGDDTNPIFKGAADGDWANATPQADGGYAFHCDLYKEPKVTAKKNDGTYGRVEFYVNESGTTNHEWRWFLTAEEMEEITHHSADGKGTATVYIRFTGKPGAPYAYLWVKMTVEVTRDQIVKYSIAEKDINYWYCATTGAITKEEDKAGCDALSAVLVNVESPKDGLDTKAWHEKQLNNWIGNQTFLVKADGNLLETTCHAKPANVTTLDEDITPTTVNGKATKAHVAKGAKLYFTPDTIKVTVPANQHLSAATDYIITPAYGAGDKEYNALIPRYNTHRLAFSSPKHFDKHDDDLTTNQYPTCKLDKTIHYYNRAANAWSKENEQDFETWANDVNNKCAIDYTAGAYNNVNLYAVKKSEWATRANYVKIAELNPSTGVLTLIHYDEKTENAEFTVVCDVLNAVGYDNLSTNHHANNINRELRAKIGVIATTKCDLATQMQNSTWLASWERPLNINPVADDKVIDAKNNANFIYMADVLKLYDWRGPEHGDMNSKKTQWLWAYYNVHYISIDCTPSNVLTNLHIQGETVTTTSDDVKDWTPLSKIDPKFVRIFADSLQTGGLKRTFNFDLRNKGRYDKSNYSTGHYPAGAPLANVHGNIDYQRNFKCGHDNIWHKIGDPSWSSCGKKGIDYDFQTRSAELYDIFNSPKYTYVSWDNTTTNGDGTAKLKDIKAMFGYIWYDNNLDNVTEFWIQVPITVGYEWGCVTTNVKIKIHQTLGNAKKR